MGYFITLFLSLSFVVWPAVLLGVGTATVALLVITTLIAPTRPARRLRRMVGSLRARVVIARHEHAGPGPADTGCALLRVDEVAVLVDGQLGIPGAVGGPATAVRVRAAVLRVELALAALLEAEPVASGRPATDADALDRALDHLDDVLDAPEDGARTAPSRGVETFTPAAELFGGFLPGSVATVATMGETARTRRGRLVPATRQALQIALAGGLCIVVGDLVSGQRWYWAVLACFLAFTGTATAAETVTKAVQRTLGTVVGVGLALVVVPALGRSVPVVLAVVLVALFLGFYLFRVSYTSLALAVTLIVAELYELMGSFSGQLLALRIGETALGAVIGGVVAVSFLPLRAGHAEAAAHSRLAEALQAALTAVADALHTRQGGAHTGDRDGGPDLHERARAVDAAVHQLALIGGPLSRRAISRAPERASVARRLENWVACAVRVRAVVHAVEDAGRGPDHADVVEAARGVRLLADALAGGEVPDRRVRRASREDDGVLLRELAALHSSLVALHEIDPEALTGPDDLHEADDAAPVQDLVLARSRTRAAAPDGTGRERTRRSAAVRTSRRRP